MSTKKYDIPEHHLKSLGQRLKDEVRRLGLDPFKYSSRDMVYRAFAGERPPMVELLYGIAKHGGSLDNIFSGISAAFSPVEAGIREQGPVYEEKRVFNKRSGLTEEQAQVLADWLSRNPEMKDLVVSWARARMKGTLSGREVDLFEVRAKAEAQYWLESIPKEADAKGG